MRIPKNKITRGASKKLRKDKNKKEISKVEDCAMSLPPMLAIGKKNKPRKR